MPPRMLMRYGLASASALALAATAGCSTSPCTSSGPVAPAAQTSASCTNPVHTIPLNPGNAQDGVTLGGLYVSNGTWNAEKYQYEQTLHVCSPRNWYAVATIDNETKEVKSYPNVHKDFDPWPRISGFDTVTSKFAHTAPGTGIYNYAYDIWLNGVGDENASEIMIWTDNHGQTPGGSEQGEFTSNGRTYTVWQKERYVAFVDRSTATSGSVNLLDFFRYATERGWIPASSTIGQIDYGVEIVQTGGVPTTFAVTDFSLTTR